jgi:hypothetical protein
MASISILERRIVRMTKHDQPVTRREVIKKAAFVAPIVLSLPAAAAFAQNGSGRSNARKNSDHHNHHDRH